MKPTTSFIASIAFFVSGLANATVIAQDNFNNGSNAGTGWSGAWTFAPAKPTGQNQNPPAPASITQSSLVFVGNDNHAAVRNLATSQHSDVFFDFTLSYTGVLEANDFVGLWLGNWNGPNIGLKANCGDTNRNATCTTDLFVRNAGSDGIFLSNSALTAGQSYQVFGHLSKSDGKDDQYDRFEAWFTLAGSNSILGTALAEGNSNIASFNQLGFRSANIDKGVNVSIDNLRVSDVPEPGSVALMGLALAGYSVARRRKRHA